MTRVLLAPDKFKGTLTAAQVAAHLAVGIASVRPDAEVVVVPVSDGGDGLLDAFEGAGFERVSLVAAGPTGVLGNTSYVRRGAEAVVEMAEVAGLVRLPGGKPAPGTATSRGLGEVIAAALDAGSTRILVGIGGSASTDGGAGMAAALGARVLDAHGDELGDGGTALVMAADVDLAGLHPALSSSVVTVACDVDNPLTGPSGAAAVYGPQKGADPDLIAVLDQALDHWADVVATGTGQDLRSVPGAGAAGGVGFAAIALLGARLRPGAEVVSELTGLEQAVAAADLVVTGEGSLDEQTLHGKAPAAVAAAAGRAGVPVVAVAGRCLLSDAQLAAAGFAAAYALTAEASYDDESFVAPGPLLERIGARIAERHLAATS
ncbi:MAG: glycerate kinase [Lapillicoccus sp.]